MATRSTAVTVAGNVVVGSVVGVGTGHTPGSGLTDFLGLSWDASQRDATPAPGGAMIGAGDETHMPAEDLNGDPRMAPCDTGAVEAP